MDAARAALTALAGVLTRGATEQDLDWLTDLDGLDEVCEWSEDQRLAEHERVMGRGVFAWESVFTREDALRTDGLSAHWYDRHGLEASEPDALGQQLALYAQTGDLDFAAHHLSRWAMPALVAIERQGGPLYPVVAGMARALLATSLPVPAHALPTFADPLEDERTGLRRLSEHLLVPVKSGWFLSRGDLLRLADAAACPCGFGSRLQMMEAYFRTAVEHDLLPRAVEVLQAELDVWVEACATHAPEWSRRALATRAVVQRLVDRA